MASQQEAIELIRSGKNVFLTGSAGCGKSWITRQITDKHTIVAASTGVAALNSGGSTCHKVFGLPFGIPTMDDYSKISSKVKKVLGSKHLKRVVLEEISMINAMQLDLINHRCQQARGNKLPFGGLQVVAVGDFFQAPPVITQRDATLYYQQYDTAFAFGARSWDFELIELEKSYRQDNDTHFRVLNSLRKKDKWTTRALEWLSENCDVYDESKDVLSLCAYKVDAERINKIHYANLKGKEFTFKGTSNNSKGWSSDITVPEVLKLKEGAKAIVRANCPDGNYVNGNRGTIRKIYPNSVIMELDCGTEIEVLSHTWEVYRYESTAKGLSKTVEFIYQQIPLQLGYSITVHSSQGLTLGEYSVNMGRGAFSSGLSYVALSRAKDLEKVSFARPILMSDIIVDQSVLDFTEGK